ncbi:hypothetical protein ACFQ3W_06090 [Paenibacillus puldeungensis]|uniref:Uncharacterized protein n=1 Tax=Paenibacillus puldeungensis TaxID=696536 RepID=A0ABW3RUP0_9BACL
MKKRGLSLINLVFFIPTIILSFAVWNDYKGYINHIDDYLPSLSGIYVMDQGNKVVGLSDKEDDGLKKAYLFDLETRKLLSKVDIRSNMFGQMKAISYQQDGVIIPTYDESSGLQLNFFKPSGMVEELAQSTLYIPNSLTSGVYSWRGRMIISGDARDTDPFIVQVKDGQLKRIALTADNLLPARPVRVDEVTGSFKNDFAVPIFEVDLKDDRTAYVSGVFDKNNRLSVLIPSKELNTFDAQDEAGARFAKSFGFNNSKLIRVDGEYPESAKFYNKNERKWGAVVPTPKPVYQARVFLLNDQEVLIAGSTAKDELDGTVLGYVFNEKTGKFTDATELLGKISYKELEGSDANFYKELGSDMLYFQSGEKAAGFMNVKSHNTQLLTTEQVEGWMVEKGANQFSLKSFWNYVKQWNAVVINWLVWLFMPLILFSSIAIISLNINKSRKKRIAQGLHLPGTIVRMEETGLFVNEQPQVRFVVQFADEGQMKEVEIKKVISYFTDIKVGDSVIISYNRKKKSAEFVTDQDVPQDQELDVIKNAVLRRTELLGDVNRSQVLKLYFVAEGREYTVPVVQPPGFEYRIGEKADLMMVQGTTRIHSYGNEGAFEKSDQISLNGEVIGVEKYPIFTGGRQLMILEVNINDGPAPIRKVNSIFVPKGLPVQAGLVIPITMRKNDFLKETRLSRGKQGAAIVTSVRFTGTLAERPLADITVERGGVAYRITQTIEPVYGVVVGDELWIAYDESTREAIIINYSTQ